MNVLPIFGKILLLKLFKLLWDFWVLVCIGGLKDLVGSPNLNLKFVYRPNHTRYVSYGWHNRSHLFRSSSHYTENGSTDNSIKKKDIMNITPVMSKLNPTLFKVAKHVVMMPNQIRKYWPHLHVASRLALFVTQLVALNNVLPILASGMVGTVSCKPIYVLIANCSNDSTNLKRHLLVEVETNLSGMVVYFFWIPVLAKK